MKTDLLFEGAGASWRFDYSDSMKSRAILTVSFLVLLVIVGLIWSRRGQNEKPLIKTPPSALDSVQKLSPHAQPTLDAEVSEKKAAKAASLDSIKASVRFKLQQWRETQTEDEASRDRLLTELLVLLTRDNAAELSRMLSTEELNSAFGLAAQWLWLEVDPKTASRWIAAQPEASEEQARLVAQQYLSDDKEMQAFCNELPDTAWREGFLSVASLEMAGSAPARAAELAKRMKPGPAQTNALETVVYDWATHDLKGAIDLVESVADPVLREKALMMTAKAIAVGDPDLGAQWLANSVKSEGMLKETGQSIVAIWAETSPADAAQWLSRVADPTVRVEAVNVLVRAWIKTDATSAQAWIQTLPERDQVLATLKADEEERKRVQE